MLRRIIENIVKLTRQITKGTDLDQAAGQYWRLSEVDDRVQDQAHWCDAMRWGRDRWIEHGNFYFTEARKLLYLFATPVYSESLSAKITLEWGCGGGSITRLLCQHFSRSYGVDISEATLNECESQMLKTGLHNFTKVFIPSQNPEDVLRIVAEGSVDFILSVAVFQHFPSKEYTQRVLHVMGRLLKSGAFAFIQVRYFDGSQKFRQRDQDYARNVIYMTSFTVEEFSSQLGATGFTLLSRERDIEGGGDCHDYYFIRKE
ncbi:MAG: class I SAM-dependent methyltransferase [Syntrophales bacterium]|nr:class I SAM-dependent methyltransferase [Syntrophales bacterium]